MKGWLRVAPGIAGGKMPGQGHWTRPCAASSSSLGSASASNPSASLFSALAQSSGWGRVAWMPGGLDYGTYKSIYNRDTSTRHHNRTDCCMLEEGQAGEGWQRGKGDKDSLQWRVRHLHGFRDCMGFVSVGALALHAGPSSPRPAPWNASKWPKRETLPKACSRKTWS